MPSSQNFFDQYDNAPSPGAVSAASAGGKNFFDRFDQKSANEASASPSSPPPMANAFDEFTQHALYNVPLAAKAGAAGAGVANLLKGGDFSEGYKNALSQEDEEAKQYSQDHPWLGKLASIGGMLGSVGPSSGAIPATLARRAGQGIIGGATIGGLNGYSSSRGDNLKQDALNTGVGAGIGATIGGAAPILSDTVISPIMNWVGRQFGPEAVQSQAMQKIADRLKMDASAGGPTAQDMLDLMNEAPGKPQTLADVGGENLQGLGGNIVRQPGPARQQVTQFLNERDVGAGSRLAGDVGSALGNGSAYNTTQALMDARSAAAKPAYDATQELSKIWSPRLQQFIDDPVMKQGLGRGMELERLDSVTNNRPFDPTQLGVDLDAQGNAVLKSVPNMRVLDMGKRGLDSMIADERNPITGRLSARGVALDQFRRSYLGEIDSLDTNGTYSAARNAWAGPSASMDAIRSGQTILSKKPEEIADEFTSLPAGDQEFYKLGAADALKDKIAKTGMTGDEAKRIIGNQYTQDQLKPLFQSPDDYDRFIKSATAENRMFNTRYSLLGGSQTAGRLAEDTVGANEALGHATRGITAGLEGAPLASVMSLAKAAGSLINRENPKVNAAIGQMLFSPDMAANQNTLAQIMAQPGRIGAYRAATVPLSSFAGRLLPSVTAPRLSYQGNP